MSWRNAVAVASITVLASWPSRQLPAAGFEVAVEDARPLARAIDEIEQRFGWTVTYEDPPYENANEIEDVTERVRRDGKAYPRVIVPRGGAFRFTYPPPYDTGAPRHPGHVLDALLSQYEASGNPGAFRLLADEHWFHVVPRAVLDVNGLQRDHASVLETSIEVDPGERSLSQAVDAIAAQITARGTPVTVGSLPINLFLQTRVRIDGRRDSARAILRRALAVARLPVTWRLYYDPGIRKYVLNFRW